MSSPFHHYTESSSRVTIRTFTTEPPKQTATEPLTPIHSSTDVEGRNYHRVLLLAEPAASSLPSPNVTELAEPASSFAVAKHRRARLLVGASPTPRPHSPPMEQSQSNPQPQDSVVQDSQTGSSRGKSDVGLPNVADSSNTASFGGTSDDGGFGLPVYNGDVGTLNDNYDF
ncbi:uncharacterized protein DS421_2g33520 [Arachis hypogaea]|nr:uncharacterized protein DS421_2g33520 [Arachis hypogaea]